MVAMPIGNSVAIDTAIAFIHPLAVILLACLWTLWILREEYRPHLEERATDSDVSPDTEARPREEGEPVTSEVGGN
jgi:hypothetical protein